MARKTRAQIADEELTQQLIEKGQARYAKAKHTREMNASAKYRDMMRAAQFNDQRRGFLERMQRAQEDAHRNESQSKIQNDIGDETARQAEEKARASTETKSQAATDAGYRGEIRSNIKPMRTAIPPKQSFARVTNSGKMYTVKPKSKLAKALGIGHSILNKYVDFDGVIDDLAKNKAAAAAYVANEAMMYGAMRHKDHQIEQRRKEMGEDQ